MEPIAQMRKDGVDKGLCRLYQAKLRDGLSVKELADLYKDGIDFCINNDYPTLDFLREHYKGMCEQYGVFIDDETGELENPKMVVLNGGCKTFVKYNGFTVARLFARHTSEGAVVVGGNATVTIDLFDNARLVVAVAGSDAQVYVNVYGNAQVEIQGEARVTYKHKNTI